MKITPQQAAEIKKLTRRANRRIERAPEGQRRYLESVVRRMTGATLNKKTGKYEGGLNKWSAKTKSLTFEEAAAQLKKLDKFLGQKSSTRRGWDEIKAELVRKANETLTQNDYFGKDKGGYTLTDDELADIMEIVDMESKEEFYRAINLVQAEKEKLGENTEFNADRLAEIIEQKIEYQDALKAATAARNARLNEK